MRKKAELTQEAVAVHGEVQQARVSEVEHGVHNITLETMANLADAVGVEVRRLLRSRRRSIGGRGVSSAAR